MSKTVKIGFDTEDQVVNEFNNWKKIKYAQSWLYSIGYENVHTLKAITTRSIG